MPSNTDGEPTPFHGETVSARLRLSERQAVVESRVDQLHDDVRVLRDRTHAHATSLQSLTLSHESLAADVKEIKTGLARLFESLAHVDGRLKRIEVKIIGGTGLVVAVLQVLGWLASSLHH